jgi:hypothetical protein
VKAVEKSFEFALAVEEWRHEMIEVKRGRKQLRVALTAAGGSAGLYVTTPSGRIYQSESGEVEVERPEPGTWRISVMGTGGTAEMQCRLEVGRP